MNSQEKGVAQRRSFRCSLPDAQQDAVLETGQRRFAVRLLNESIEGVAVWVEGSPGVEADEVVRLSTTFGRFEARVVHVVQLAPAQTGGERGKPQFCLGLEWLKEPKAPSAMQQMPPPETA